MTATQITALILFVFTYLLISARPLHFLPLGRPAAALLGATLMVACGVVLPEQAYAAIDGNTIILLLAMMILTEHLEEAGFFQLAALWTFRIARSPRLLLFWLAMTSGVLSALFVNDTVCLLLTPLVVHVLGQTRLPRFPYLMTVATASNIGSVMTLVGNPQNMIIGSLAQQKGHGLDYVTFALHMVPVGLVCLGLHVLLLQWTFRKELAGPWEVAAAPPAAVNRRLLRRTLVVVAAVSVAFCLRLNPAWAALAGGCALMAWNRQHPPAAQVLARLDWSLLLFFCGLFVAVHGLETSGLKDVVWEHAGGLWQTSPLGQRVNLVWVSVVGSNVVSNVPFIKLVEGQMDRFANPRQMWMLLAMATTFAGNLTLLGSVANVIVLETSGEPVGFWQYFRVGLPVTLLSCAVGTALVLLLT
jgi:Na+/H+ antiporter NhaD/arsenite permease-like protein